MTKSKMSSPVDTREYFDITRVVDRVRLGGRNGDTDVLTLALIAVARDVNESAPDLNADYAFELVPGRVTSVSLDTPPAVTDVVSVSDADYA